jgi:hypothetical protein
MLGRCTTGPKANQSRFIAAFGAISRADSHVASLPFGSLILTDTEKEAGSALPFTPRPAGVANISRGLRRGCQNSASRSSGHFTHEAARLPKTTKREVQTRFGQLLVPKPAI